MQTNDPGSFLPPAAPSSSSNQPDNSTSGDDQSGFALRPERILLHEFDFARETALQAIKDRTRTLNLYYLLVGIFLTSLTVAYQLSNKQLTIPLELEVVLFAAAGAVSSGFFARFIRLRHMYRDSLTSMNLIKELYITQTPGSVPPIGTVFHWRMSTIVENERLTVATLFVCHVIAVIASACYAGAAFLGDQLWHNDSGQGIAVGNPEPFIIASSVAVVSLITHLVLYWVTIGGLKSSSESE